MARQSASRAASSMPRVGSSSNAICGAPARTAAIAARCRSPVLRSRGSRSTRRRRPSSAINAVASALCASPRTVHATSAATVARWSRAIGFCGRKATLPGARSTCPESGASSPAMVRSSVVFPPPLGPTRATTSPSCPSRADPFEDGRARRTGRDVAPARHAIVEGPAARPPRLPVPSTMRRVPPVAPSAMFPPSTAITRPLSEPSWSMRCSATTTAVPDRASAARMATSERAPSSSSWESGSSSTSRRGRIARTPASARRWRSPPESVATARPRRCAMPARSSASPTRRSIAAGAMAMFSSPNATSRSTVGYTDCNSGSWNTNPTSVASTRVAVDMTSCPQHLGAVLRRYRRGNGAPAR